MLASPLLAEEASGLGALGLDLGALIAYLVNFGVLLLLLYLLVESLRKSLSKYLLLYCLTDQPIMLLD